MILLQIKNDNTEIELDRWIFFFVLECESVAAQIGQWNFNMSLKITRVQQMQTNMINKCHKINVANGSSSSSSHRITNRSTTQKTSVQSIEIVTSGLHVIVIIWDFTMFWRLNFSSFMQDTEENEDKKKTAIVSWVSTLFRAYGQCRIISFFPISFD